MACCGVVSCESMQRVLTEFKLNFVRMSSWQEFIWLIVIGDVMGIVIGDAMRTLRSAFHLLAFSSVLTMDVLDKNRGVLFPHKIIKTTTKQSINTINYSKENKRITCRLSTRQDAYTVET